MQMMQIKILDNINAILYDQNWEAGEIWRVTQPEIDAIHHEALRIFDNTRTINADIEGIKLGERVYGIIPDPSRDTLEERRERILEAKRSQPPYTESWLMEEIKNRFPNGGASAQLRDGVLEVFVDIEFGGLNELGHYRRQFVELLSWFRGWIPAGLLISAIPIQRRPLVTTNVHIAGHVFRKITRPLQRPQGAMPQPCAHPAKFDIESLGIRTDAYIILEGGEVKRMLFRADGGNSLCQI